LTVRLFFPDFRLEIAGGPKPGSERGDVSLPRKEFMRKMPFFLSAMVLSVDTDVGIGKISGVRF
jgi:hypothetical protein